MKSNGDIWRERAEQAGIPLVSVWHAQETLIMAKRTKTDASMARLMLRHGRLTEEARAYVAKAYPQA